MKTLTVRAAAAACLAAAVVLLAAAPGLTGEPDGRRPARAVIQVWLWGGPSHLDTFDPKPGAGPDYHGPYANPIETVVPGIMIGEKLPLLAARADRYSLIRSMTHGVNGHETAAYMVQTGRQPGGGLVYPSAGAVVAFMSRRAGYSGALPPYVTITRSQGRFPEWGFLGREYAPFTTGGDPSRTPFLVEGIVARGIDPERQAARAALLGALDTLPARRPDEPAFREYRALEEEAWDFILGEEGRVFDLSGETEETRDRYGRTKFGQSCLLARRLVERGVVFVTINFEGWDTHKQHFQAMERLLPDLDRGLSALLEDLDARGLLDSTIVWCGGEFGRTPKIDWEVPWNGGRGHYGRVFSVLVAGGGFRGGQVVGASDEKGERVAERPVYPWDLIGSIYELMGIDPDGTIPHPEGFPVRLLPDPALVESGGRLREIMK